MGPILYFDQLIGEEGAACFAFPSFGLWRVYCLFSLFALPFEVYVVGRGGVCYDL